MQRPPPAYQTQATSSFPSFNGLNYYQAAYSSHYAQAYMQSLRGQQPHVNPEGYALSSTYTSASTSNAGPARTNGTFIGRPPSWYQPGSHRCTYKDCKFTGSLKSLEIHRMDRHLIYPPGWDKQRKKPEWDADPSLKGKPIPIQGTNIFLDTPEALEAWIEERKRRWPSNIRVEEKRRKLDEATARGQLTMDDLGLHGNKRRRTYDGRTQQPRDSRGGSRGRGQRIQRGRGRGIKGGGGSSVWNTASSRPEPFPANSITRDPGRALVRHESEAESSALEDSDSDGAPEAVSSKALQGLGPLRDVNTSIDSPNEDIPRKTEISGSQLKPIKKLVAPQPRKQPHNPFDVHKTLLRNLLLPEIRVTVSNLSQAIRFLVDNNFLDDVELTPGEAGNRKIEVLTSGG